MPVNDPANDRYNPASIGSEFEKHLFDDINVGEIFRLHDNTNEETIVYRKENETQAMNVKSRGIADVPNETVVYVTI